MIQNTKKERLTLRGTFSAVKHTLTEVNQIWTQLSEEAKRMEGRQ